MPLCYGVGNGAYDSTTLVAFVNITGTLAHNTNTIIAAFDSDNKYRGHSESNISPSFTFLPLDRRKKEVHSIVINYSTVNGIIHFKYWWNSIWYNVQEKYTFIPLDISHSHLLNAMVMTVV